MTELGGCDVIASNSGKTKCKALRLWRLSSTRLKSVWSTVAFQSKPLKATTYPPSNRFLTLATLVLHPGLQQIAYVDTETGELQDGPGNEGAGGDGGERACALV
jgi:hypothetical protein